MDLGLDAHDPYGSGQLAGDFYNNSNNVTRGAPMSLSALGTTGFPASGDFYSFIDADVFLKDKSLGLQHDSDGYPGSSTKLGFDKEQLLERGDGASSKLGTSGERFSETNPAPKVPQDSFFVFAPTTIRIVCDNDKGSPSGIGNAIIEFFENEVESTILKIRPEKFWVSANVFVEGRMVRVKARIYKEDKGKYALEFQRRTGCAVIFTQLYKKVLQFVHQKGYQVDGGQDQGVDQKLEDSPSFGAPPPLPLMSGDVFDFAPPPIPSLRPGDDKERYDFDFPPPPPPLLAAGMPGRDATFGQETPLIGMMVLADAPSLQAEAFNSLAALFLESSRGQPPVLGTNQDFVKNVTYLLTGPFPDDPEAEYAFVRLLAHAACDPEVSQGFAKEGILSSMADKVYTETVSAIAKKEIAFALAQAAKHLKESTKEGMHELAKDLEESISESFDGALKMDHRVKDLLAEARKCLSRA